MYEYIYIFFKLHGVYFIFKYVIIVLYVNKGFDRYEFINNL